MGFGKDGTGAILREHNAITTGTLASVTAVKQAGAIAIEDDFRIIKVEYIATQGINNDFGTGETVVLGIANDELSVAEIAECLVTDGPVDRNDRVQMERAERAVWLIDVIGDDPFTVARGEKVLRWTFSNPEGWTWFAWNPMADALAASSVINLDMKYFGVWVT